MARPHMIAGVIDVILALVVVEGVALVLFHRRTGQGVAPRRLIANLAAGFFLMLGVRLALAQAAEGVIATCLVAALVAHVFDLAAAWRQDG